MKIKHIIIVLFVVLSAIPMTLMGVANMYFYNTKLENVMENDLRNTARIQMKAIDNFLAERRFDAEIIVRNPLVYALLEDSDPASEAAALINNILALRAENNPYVESATILDTDFSVAACSEPSVIGTISALKDIDPKYFTPNLLFTPVTMREGSHSRIIAAVMEIYNGSHLDGYLVLELNLAFFDELRDSAKVYNNGTVYIIDGNNALITAGDTVSSRDEFILAEEERADYHRAWAARDKNSSSGILRYTARGEHYLTYYSQFESIDWIILSSVNIDALLQTRRGYFELALLIILVLACLLLAVNYIVRRYMGKPIQKMIKKFELISQTKDYSIRMEGAESSEINTISASINQLLAGMEEYVRKESLIKADLTVKAERDPLTGLYNKEAFTELVNKQLENARQQNTPLACIFLDIDDFKDFNTAHGHAFGDKVLVFIAEALRSQIGDLACRQGGDEFTVCIPDASDQNRIMAMIDDLLATLHHGLRPDDKGSLMPVNCSIGIVFSSQDTLTASQLIEHSDAAMYAVKKETKNGYQIWQGNYNA